jgi:DNA-binding MarR family transcriptional regulator
MTLANLDSNEASLRAAAIRRGLMRLSRRLRTERSGQPLSSSKLSLMGWLRRSGGMTATGIAAAERIRPQSLTRLLAALTADGLIRRRTDEADQRQVVIELTNAGYRALEQDMRQRDAWLARAMTQSLSPVEQEFLVLAAQLMERLAGTDLTPTDETDEGAAP